MAPRRHRVPLRVGCSGWMYKSWKGRFYPANLPTTQWLRHYSAHFSTVEINNTFYRLPEQATFASWYGQTPAGFCFAIKASRFLTHLKRLREPREPLQRLLDRLTPLGPKLGPVLYQLPANFGPDLDRLAHFLDALQASSSRVPADLTVRHVLEFRDPAWYTDETFALLERAGVALCLHDKHGSIIQTPFVGPFVYVRFHGPSGHYSGRYAQDVLNGWAVRLAEQSDRGRALFVYFNNDVDGAAPIDAAYLSSRLQLLNREASARE